MEFKNYFSKKDIEDNCYEVGFAVYLYRASDADKLKECGVDLHKLAIEDAEAIEAWEDLNCCALEWDYNAYISCGEAMKVVNEACNNKEDPLLAFAIRDIESEYEMIKDDLFIDRIKELFGEERKENG